MRAGWANSSAELLKEVQALDPLSTGQEYSSAELHWSPSSSSYACLSVASSEVLDSLALRWEISSKLGRSKVGQGLMGTTHARLPHGNLFTCRRSLSSLEFPRCESSTKGIDQGT